MRPKTKWLLFLPLLIAPVMAEMTINASGLPTPWPIALISIFVSLVSIFTFRLEKLSFGRFAKLVLFYDIIRPSMILLSSLISLILGGWDNFRYPEMALLSSLSLPFFVFSVKRGLEKLETEFTPEVIPLQNRNENEELVIDLASQRGNYQTLKKIYSLRWLCWGIVMVSFFWQVLAVNTTVSNSVVDNSPRVYQFVIDCAKEPWTNCQRVNSFSFPYRCFLTDLNVETWGSIMSYLCLSATLIAAYLSVLPTMFPSLRRSQRAIKYIKFLLLFWVYIVPWLTFVLYTIINGTGQASGPASHIKLSPEEKIEYAVGPEKLPEILKSKYGCDINLSLFTSKTGYLKEWAEQKWTSFDEGFSGITRKIALV